MLKELLKHLSVINGTLHDEIWPIFFNPVCMLVCAHYMIYVYNHLIGMHIYEKGKCSLFHEHVFLDGK